MLNQTIVAQTGKTNFVGPGWLLTCSLIYFVCVTASDSWWDLLVLVLLLSSASTALRVRAKTLLSLLRSSWIMIFFATVIHLVFRIWFVGEQDMTITNSVIQTAFFVSRFVLVILMTFSLLSLYSPAVFAETAASKLGFVLGRSLAAQASHVSFLAFSMLPQIRGHVADRRLARKLRNISMPKDLKSKLVWARHELSSVLHFALDYAGDVATILWSRGFRPENLGNLTAKYPTSRAGLVLATGFCILCLTTLLPWPTN